MKTRTVFFVAMAALVAFGIVAVVGRFEYSSAAPSPRVQTANLVVPFPGGNVSGTWPDSPGLKLGGNVSAPGLQQEARQRLARHNKEAGMDSARSCGNNLLACKKKQTSNQCEWHSQFHEDMDLVRMFFHGADAKTGTGTFVELGARDGLLHSNTLHFESCLGWRGVLFEPKSAEFDQLCTNRPCSVSYNIAAAEAEKNVQFVGDGGAAGSTTTMTETHRSRWNQGKSTWLARGGRLQDYVLSSGISHVDLFSLDVEGGERQVLESLNLEQLTIGVLIYEHINMPERDQEAVEALLAGKNFSFVSCQPNPEQCFNKIWIGQHVQLK